MIEIEFELDSDGSPITGYDMGHMKVIHDEVVIDSKAGGSRHLMMLFFSIAELTSGLEQFVLSKKISYEFIGNDSSFCIQFKKSKSRILSISFSKKISFDVDEVELLRAVYDASFNFWDTMKCKLDKDDIVIEDMNESIADLENLLINYD